MSITRNGQTSHTQGHQTDNHAIPDPGHHDTSSTGLGTIEAIHAADAGNKWMMLTGYQYSRSSISSAANRVQSTKTMALPLPEELEAEYSMKWGSVDMGALAARVLQGLSGNDKPTSISDFFKNGLGDIYNNGSQYFSAIATDASNILDETTQAIGGQYLGAVRNPNVSVLFQGPELRTFPFSFRIYPKTIEEYDQVNEIIQTIKTSMAPDFYLGSQSFLGTAAFAYPDIWQIDFLINGKSTLSSRDMFSIGMCACVGMKTNFHSQGKVYMQDQESGRTVPGVLEFSLVFQELEILTKQSIQEKNR